MSSQNEEGYLSNKAMFEFCQILLQKFAFMGREKNLTKKMKKIEIFNFFKNENEIVKFENIDLSPIVLAIFSLKTKIIQSEIFEI